MQVKTCTTTQNSIFPWGESFVNPFLSKIIFIADFGFEPKNVDDYSFKRNKSFLEEPICSTSLSNEQEEGTKSEESSNPSACSSILRFFGFSSRRVSKSNDHSTFQGETSSCLKEDAPEDLAYLPLLQ